MNSNVHNGIDLQEEKEEEEHTHAYKEEEEELPPDWVALEDLDSGDVYYANEVSERESWFHLIFYVSLAQLFVLMKHQVTGETTWDRPIMTEEEKRALQQQQQQQQNQPPPAQAQVATNNNDTVSSKKNLNQQESLTIDDIMKDEVVNDDEISADDSLPRDWLPLVDPDSGDTYYSNEVTGETTWDKPQFGRDDTEEETSEVTPSLSDNRQSLLELDEAVDDSIAEDESNLLEEEERLEDLPEGWFSILDPDSGDVYYSNEITGETTW